MGDCVSVSLKTDSEGFMSQECPSCERRFKVRPGEGSDQPIAFCPYCGYTGRDCWWTPEQAAYISAKVSAEVVGPELDAIAREFNGRVNRGALRLSMKVSRSPTPAQPAEPDDNWPRRRFDCCGEVIQYEGSGLELHCIICGSGT